jgi:hypothetical protein
VCCQEVITNGGTSVTESFGACEESHTQRDTVPGSPSVDEAEWLGRCSGCLYDIAVLQYRQHTYRLQVRIQLLVLSIALTHSGRCDLPS